MKTYIMALYRHGNLAPLATRQITAETLADVYCQLGTPTDPNKYWKVVRVIGTL